jgi:hypothetical protein
MVQSIPASQAGEKPRQPLVRRVRELTVE